VDEPIADRVSQRGLAHQLVPGLNRHLAGDDQQTDPLVEAEFSELGRAELTLAGLGHRGEMHRGHLVDGGVSEHGRVPSPVL
jgi:hypothetical protein